MRPRYGRVDGVKNALKDSYQCGGGERGASGEIGEIGGCRRPVNMG